MRADPQGGISAGGADKAERRRAQGAARPSGRQAKQCPTDPVSRNQEGDQYRRRALSIRSNADADVLRPRTLLSTELTLTGDGMARNQVAGCFSLDVWFADVCAGCADELPSDAFGSGEFGSGVSQDRNRPGQALTIIRGRSINKLAHRVRLSPPGFALHESGRVRPSSPGNHSWGERLQNDSVTFQEGHT